MTEPGAESKPGSSAPGTPPPAPGHRAAADLAAAIDPWGMRELIARPGRLLWINFLAGLVRGAGFTLGAAALGGILLSLAINMARPMLQVPVLGRFVARVISAVEEYESRQPASAPRGP